MEDLTGFHENASSRACRLLQKKAPMTNGDAILQHAEIIVEAVALSQAMLDGDLQEARFRARLIATKADMAGLGAVGRAAGRVVDRLGRRVNGTTTRLRTSHRGSVCCYRPGIHPAPVATTGLFTVSPLRSPSRNRVPVRDGDPPAAGSLFTCQNALFNPNTNSAHCPTGVPVGASRRAAYLEVRQTFLPSHVPTGTIPIGRCGD